ncbi:unnamed protein product [Cunninghamella blakesleeana]
MKTYLETHIANQHVKSNMERHNALHHIEQFLKNGLLDAIPHVREVCRQIFWLYQQHYPSRSEKILQSFDILTRKQIEKLKPDDTNSNIVRKRGLSTYNQPKSQRLKLDKDHVSNNNKPLPKPLNTTKPILTPPVFRRTVSDSSMYKLNKYSKVTTPISPSSSSSPKLKTLDKEICNNNNNVNNSSNHKNDTTPILASASLLHMLRSDNVNVNCNALRILADRLIPHCQTPLYENDILLPSTVPSRVDLIPVLLDYLSPEKMLKSESLCNQLMSWDCLAGIFVNLLTLQHFIPTLILASHRECRYGNNKNCQQDDQNDNDSKDGDIELECQLKYYVLTTTIGLKRLKLYLKFNYPNLVKSLLDILLMTTYVGGAGLKDPNAKKQLFSSKSILSSSNNKNSSSNMDRVKVDLVYGLLNWIDELLCDYMGLNQYYYNNNNNNNNSNNNSNNNNNDNDTTERPYIMKGSEPWLSKDQLNIAMDWFKNNDNMELCFESILRLFKTPTLSIHPTLFTLFISLIKHIKSSNQQVFDSVVNQLDDDVTTIKLLDTFLGNDNPTISDQQQQQQDNTSLNVSENYTIENSNEISDGNDGGNDENDRYYQNTEELLYDEPPPSYNDVLLQQQLEEEDDEINHSSQTSPSADISQYQHYPVDDINNASLELLSDEIDALDTSYGSIHLDTISPEPPLTSTQEPNDIDIMDEHNDTNNEEQNKKQDTQVNNTNTNINSIHQTSAYHSIHLDTKNKSNNDDRRLTDIITLLQLCKKDNDIINKMNPKYFQNKNSWIQPVHDKEGGATIFEYTLQTIIDHLNHSIDNKIILNHLHLLKNLIIHQSALFQDESILPFNHLLARKSIYLNREKYSQIAIIIDDILNRLFKTIHINSGITILESILDEELIRQNKQQIASFSTILYVDPLDTLFNILSTVSSRMTSELVAQLLKKPIWITIFMMGFNHSILSIRKSCVNTLVSFSHVLSNEDIQHYLPGLKDEQRHLLDHYIQQQKKK